MKRNILLTTLMFLFVIPCVSQESSRKSKFTPTAQKFASVVYPDATDLSIRMGRFIKVLRKKSSAKACVIVYAINNEYMATYGKALLNVAERELKAAKIAANRIILIKGGFREDPTVELFILPKGVAVPVPTPNSMEEYKLKN